MDEHSESEVLFVVFPLSKNAICKEAKYFSILQKFLQKEKNILRIKINFIQTQIKYILLSVKLNVFY